MGKSVIEDIKYDEGQQNLSEKQINDIAAEALREVKEPADSQDDWVNPADAQTDEDNQDKSREDIANKDKEVKETESKKEEERVKAETDAKLKSEQESSIAKEKINNDKNKADIDPKTGKSSIEEKKFQIPAEQRYKAIEELALKESLTLEEAEAQISKDESTVNKYKNDPVEMARALRHLQREGDKAKAELDAVKKSGNTPPAPIINNVKDYVQHQLDPIKDKVVEAYRKEYPELVDGQTDDYVYGLVKKDAVDRTLKIMEENQSKIVSAAKEKRANLIMSLSEQDKTFLPDIKAIIDRTSDRQIMAKDYDIKYVIEWAKGKQVDRLVKEAEERGFKRGQEQPKILGEKNLGHGKTPSPSGGTKKIQLSEVQKQRALDMFDSVQTMSDQDKYDAYVETYPEEFKS